MQTKCIDFYMCPFNVIHLLTYCLLTYYFSIWFLFFQKAYSFLFMQRGLVLTAPRTLDIGYCTIFTRTWLSYVRVFAIANPSVVCRLLYVVCLQRWRILLRGLKVLAIVLYRCVPWPSSDFRAKFDVDRPSVGGVKHRRRSKIERFLTCQRLYLINGTR